MVTTEPLIGARITDQKDGPLGGLQIANSLRDTIPYTSPAFATAAARNTAYAAWVAAGGAMRDGLTCSVAGVPLIYRASKWRGAGPGPMYSGTGPGSFGPWVGVGDADPRVVGRINIPDPGYDYRVRVFGSFEAYNSDAAGNPISSSTYRVDSYINTSGTNHDFWRGDVGNLHKHADISPNVLSGPQIINMQAQRIVGSSGFWTTTSFNFYMRAEVVPV